MKNKLIILSFAAVVMNGVTQLNAADAVPPPPPADGAPKGKGGPPNGSPGQRPKINPEEFFKRMDTNGDGTISKEEFIAHAKKEAEERFAKIDANGDGKIDKAEIAEAMKKMREHMGEGGGGMREKIKEKMKNKGQEGAGPRKRPQADGEKANNN